MSYYHIHIVVNDTDFYEYDQTRGSVQKLCDSYMQGRKFIFSGVTINPFEVTTILIYETQNRSAHYSGPVWDVGKPATREFVHRPPSESEKSIESKDVFIVHGRDHESMKELKAILYDLGFNPIILHEQPSRGRTIVEKLEKYSNVGYAFVILTPDDVGCLRDSFYRAQQGFLQILKRAVGDADKITQAQERFHEIVNTMKRRARQNVVLEFGYFAGLLGRENICCLHKGNVELPSDMDGIVYIPFKDSVEEARIMIMRELKNAGYVVKI